MKKLLALVLLLLAVSAAAQAQDISEFAPVPASTIFCTPALTFNFGSGKNRFNFCITPNGNLTKTDQPLGI